MTKAWQCDASRMLLNMMIIDILGRFERMAALKRYGRYLRRF